MLNLIVGMNKLFFTLVLAISLLSSSLQAADQQVTIDSPKPGEALQGNVEIKGTTQMDGFQSYQVSFSYQHDSTYTWFPISEGKDPVKEGNLATWDTTTITDGTYRLRVKVFLKDGRTMQALVTGLRVRNYTAIETSTPAPPSESGTESVSTPEPGDYAPSGATLTPQGGNPVSIDKSNLADSLLKGGIAAMVLFILLGVYFAIRTLFRRG